MKTSLLALLVLFGLVIGDVQAQTSRTITWTAPGDDGNVGTATTYDIRYSTDSAALVNSFLAATLPPGVIAVNNEPVPKVAGSTETYAIVGLSTGVKYYVAIKTADEVPNWSGLSNIFSFTLTDTTPPAAIIDLR